MDKEEKKIYARSYLYYRAFDYLLTYDDEEEGITLDAMYRIIDEIHPDFRNKIRKRTEYYIECFEGDGLQEGFIEELREFMKKMINLDKLRRRKQ